MKRFAAISTTYLLLVSTLCYGAASNPNIRWRMHFYDIQASDNQTDNLRRCIAQTPNVVEASIEDLLKQGVEAANGVHIKYNNYDASNKLGLIFTTIYATTSQNSQQQSSSKKLTLFSQSLSPDARAQGVWSSGECKGRFEARALFAPLTQEQVKANPGAADAAPSVKTLPAKKDSPSATPSE